MRGRADARMRSRAEDGRSDAQKVGCSDAQTLDERAGERKTEDIRADDWKVGGLEGWTLDGKTGGLRTEDGGPMHNGFKNI